MRHTRLLRHKADRRSTASANKVRQNRMSTRKSPIQFRATHCAGEQVLTGAELRELERLLARLVARAYLADHPQLLTAQPNEETRRGTTVGCDRPAPV